MLKNRIHGVLALAALMTACGGGGGGSSTPPPLPPPAKATSLAYSDPAGSGFRLLRQPESTPTKLVLGLMGPTGGQGRGIAFTLTADPAQVDVVKVADGDSEYLQPGTVFDLGSGPRIHKGLLQGGALRATLAQKGISAPKTMNGILAKFALQFRSSANMNSGTTIALGATEGEYLPATGAPVTMTIELGTLRAQ